MTDNTYVCNECGKEISSSEAYEYRGRVFCEAHDFEEQATKRECERLEVVRENDHKTKRLKGLDFSDSQIGKANRLLLKGALEVARNEGERTKKYEGRS